MKSFYKYKEKVLDRIPEYHIRLKRRLRCIQPDVTQPDTSGPEQDTSVGGLAGSGAAVVVRDFSG